jgi:hypothetical protein
MGTITYRITSEFYWDTEADSTDEVIRQFENTDIHDAVEESLRNQRISHDEISITGVKI